MMIFTRRYKNHCDFIVCCKDGYGGARMTFAAVVCCCTAADVCDLDSKVS
jgi:hypothetical protein